MNRRADAIITVERAHIIILTMQFALCKRIYEILIIKCITTIIIHVHLQYGYFKSRVIKKNCYTLIIMIIIKCRFRYYKIYRRKR